MRKLAVAAALVALLVAVLFVGLRYFAPEASVDVAEAAPEGATALAEGAFAGADRLHRVEGTVRVLDTPDGPVLRFEGYEATDGPDVFFYVVAPGADASDPEAYGTKVPLDGTPDGHATKRGDFNQPLPDGLRAEDVGAVVVWCDRFDTEFGRATLA